MTKKNPLSKKIEGSLPVRYLFLLAAILGALGTVSAAMFAIFNLFSSSEEDYASFQGEVCWYFEMKCMNQNDALFTFLDQNIGRTTFLNLTIFRDNFKSEGECSDFLGFQNSDREVSISLPVAKTENCLIQGAITFEKSILRKSFDARTYTNFSINGFFFIEKSISASSPAFYDYKLAITNKP